jgi:signal transduction histidine kinase
LPQQPGGQSSPFQLVKVLSWSFFVLILGSSLALSMFIANRAKETVLEKQQEYAILLAENLNHQIYQRFTLPTLIGFGRIQLKDKPQFDRLEQVVQSTIHSFHVLEVRIYDDGGVVSYSTDKDAVGREGLAGANVGTALAEGGHFFDLVTRTSPFWSAFRFDPEPESIVLRTVYPLRAERGLGFQGPAGPIMGVLELKQDITKDYSAIVNLQMMIVVSSSLSSLILFFILLSILRRADRANAQRLEERAQLERELHQHEKLASMGRVVASIAHEIRNPLGIIRSSAELLLSKAPEGDPYRRIIQAMFDEAKRLSKTVGDFLDYARPRSPRRDAVELAPLLDQMLMFFEPECDKRAVRVFKEYGRDLVISGDKDLLYRAFYNIVANALQAMDGGGEVRVMSAAANGDVTLSFRDTGPGFDAATKDKLLDPFFTTKDTGTGLGLAIVNSILEGHKAKLSLHDAPGGGAQVDVTFPKRG